MGDSHMTYDRCLLRTSEHFSLASLRSMSGPKHLWSGNWEEESPEPAQSAVPQPSPAPAASSREALARRPPSRSRRFWLPVLAAVAVTAVALTIVLNGSSPHRLAHHTSPAASRAATVPTITLPTPNIPSPSLPSPSSNPAQTTPAAGLTGRTVSWLGMEISTVQGVGAVIQTVDLGSAADAAGLDPGDIIQSINGHAISYADQIGPAVKGVRRGTGVPISVQRGSTAFGTVIVFASAPKTGP